jgi:hypothetical protein
MEAFGMGRFWVFVLVTALSGPVSALDVEDTLFSNPQTDAFTTFGFDLQGSSGNRDSTEFEIEGSTTHRGDSTTWLLGGAIEDTETNGVKTDESQQAHFRYIRRLDTAHNLEMLIQYKRDTLQGVTRQTLVGPGYRYASPTGKGKGSFAVGVGIMREQTNYTTGVDERVTRANLYAAFNTKLGSGGTTTLSLSAMARPNVANFSDYRLLGLVTLSAKISERIAVNLQLEADHDSDPTLGIESRDVKYSSGISYTFK